VESVYSAVLTDSLYRVDCLSYLKGYYPETSNYKSVTFSLDLQLTYASETWVLKENVLNKRKIMRKICGSTRTDDGYWRIKTNQEINDMLKGQYVIWFVKKQRLGWLGHVERMTEGNIVQDIKRWKPTSKRPIGRPKMRWEVHVLEDVRSVDVRNWKKVA
jgi:hypothetical protein